MASNSLILLEDCSWIVEVIKDCENQGNYLNFLNYI